MTKRKLTRAKQIIKYGINTENNKILNKHRRKK